MMKYISLFLYILIMISSSGCAAMIEVENKIMESWDGKHVSALMRSWGPSQQVVPDGNG